MYIFSSFSANTLLEHKFNVLHFLLSVPAVLVFFCCTVLQLFALFFCFGDQVLSPGSSLATDFFTAILYRTFTYIFSPISYVRGKCSTRVRLAASRAAGAATAPVPWVRRLFLAWGNQCLACHACQECFAKSRSRSRHSTLLLEPRFFQFRSRWIMDSLLEDITLDARLRLEKKIRDSNRTLTAISSERRTTIDVDGVHRLVFQQLFPICHRNPFCAIYRLSPGFCPPSLFFACTGQGTFVSSLLFSDARIPFHFPSCRLCCRHLVSPSLPG